MSQRTKISFMSRAGQAKTDNTQDSDPCFRIEIKENDALIIFTYPPYDSYSVSVSDPIEFSIEIYKVLLKHYKKVGDKERYEKLKLAGFDYRKYVS